MHDFQTRAVELVYEEVPEDYRARFPVVIIQLESLFVIVYQLRYLNKMNTREEPGVKGTGCKGRTTVRSPSFYC